jgi:hypothetical protein
MLACREFWFRPAGYKFCDSNLRPPFLSQESDDRFLLEFTSRTSAHF